MKSVSPNQCSVLIFENEMQELESTLAQLDTLFSKVTVKSTQNDIILALKANTLNDHQHTILLIDAESCHSSLPDQCPDLLLKIVELLKQGVLTHVVPIVCSTQDSPTFMVKCLEAGAADFVLKPLSRDVMKTLFLNVTRYHIQPNAKECHSVDQLGQQGGQVWLKFKERLKGMFAEENWLSKLVADFYTPKPSMRRSSMKSMIDDRKEELKSQICSWNFLPLDLDDKDLIQVVFMILEQTLNTFDQLEPLRVPNDDLYHFIFDICNSYHPANPYHNFRHAVDVLQANYYFLCKLGMMEPMTGEMELIATSQVKELLQPLDIFALLMASIGHDVSHPGVNNHFMVTSSTPLAILYNDKSVLESFHAMAFFHLLQANCFQPLTDMKAHPEYAGFRKIVVNSILATDMSMHDEYVLKIRDQAERLKRNDIDFSDQAACEKERILLCGALIKCADISNCARPFDSAKRWAKILAEEFFEQGDLELEMGMPVLPINSRGKLSLEDFQLGFKKCVALKLFESISKVSSQMQFTVDYINKNIAIWETRKKEGLPPSPTMNSIPPPPSPGESCTSSQRSRTGI